MVFPILSIFSYVTYILVSLIYFFLVTPFPLTNRDVYLILGNRICFIWITLMQVFLYWENFMVKGRNTLSNILLLIFLRVTLKSQGLQSKGKLFSILVNIVAPWFEKLYFSNCYDTCSANLNTVSIHIVASVYFTNCSCMIKDTFG